MRTVVQSATDPSALVNRPRRTATELGLIVLTSLPLYAIVSAMLMPNLRARLNEKFARGAENHARPDETITGIPRPSRPVRSNLCCQTLGRSSKDERENFQSAEREPRGTLISQTQHLPVRRVTCQCS